MLPKTDWNGKRVLILGAARQGQAAARWLARHGARVTLNDRRSQESLYSALSALADIPIKWALGGHPLELLDAADILCISGGIPMDNPLVVAAVSRGLPLTNDTQVFMEVAPCRTVGITGSAGKTTTTSLVGLMAKAASSSETAHPWSAFTGGNIGDPLLNYVDEMTPQDLAVLEISSFQLEQMTRSPEIAAVLNITPNHLDRHGSMAAYTAAKQRILQFQGTDSFAVLNRTDPGSWNLRADVRGKLISFGSDALPAGQDGTFVADGHLHMHWNDGVIPLLGRNQIQLRGEHNLMNVLAALAIGFAAGLPVDAMLTAAAGFRGVEHRLEFVRKLNGAEWYNDSIATAPERTVADIRSFSEPIVLLLGGRDKDLPWDDLAALVRQRVQHVVLFGESAAKIASALDHASGPFPLSIDRVGGLEEAVHAAAKRAEPGSVVLLAPGGTSFDQFVDFEARGKAFRKWVLELS